MKRTFAKLLSLFVVLTLVIAMVPAVFAVDGTVSAGKTLLNVKEETTISVKNADGADVSNVTLTSSPADIVSISGMTITAQKVGSATITATVTEGGETQTLGSVTITVQSGVSAITPDTSSIEIDADNAKTASLSVTLTDAASGNVLAVRSSDESVVTAQAGAITLSDGTCTVTLTAVKTGTAAVTLSCGTATAQVTVTVKATKDHTVTFEKQKLTVKKGETAVNPVTKTPAAGDKLTYVSSSTAVATVDASTGAVTGVAAGTATITATVKNASDVIVGTASYTVEVADAYKIEPDGWQRLHCLRDGLSVQNGTGLRALSAVRGADVERLQGARCRSWRQRSEQGREDHDEQRLFERHALYLRDRHIQNCRAGTGDGLRHDQRHDLSGFSALRERESGLRALVCGA